MIGAPTLIPTSTNIRQQRPNFYIGHKAEPGNLVPQNMFMPSDHNMDQGNQCRVFLKLARSDHQAHHKTSPPLSQHCPGPPLTTIPKYKIYAHHRGPSPAPKSKTKNKQCVHLLQTHKHHLFRSNRGFPSHIQPWIPLHHVCVCV